MTVSPLDPTLALLVIDLQTGTLGNPAIQPVDDVVANARMLADAFRERSLPVVLLRVTGTPPGRNGVGGARPPFPEAATVLVPGIGQQADDLVLTRATWSGFAGTDLADQLAARGITQVVIVGVATSFGIESTARDAYDLGLHVVVVTDAIKDMRAEAHVNSVERIFPMLGEVGVTADVLALLP